MYQHDRTLDHLPTSDGRRLSILLTRVPPDNPGR